MNNTVELLGVYGSDETHALSAWTSTSRELTLEKRERIGALLKQLASAGHETPFEKSALHFLVTTDIATHIHLLKHRIGVSINGESARYKELKEDKAYIPSNWPDDLQATLLLHATRSQELYHDAIHYLVLHGLSKKRAKESARFFLPYASQITADVQFNFRSFVHFLRLRNTEHAQVEIRFVAQEMLRLVKRHGTFPLTIKAFEL